MCGHKTFASSNPTPEFNFTDMKLLEDHAVFIVRLPEKPVDSFCPFLAGQGQFISRKTPVTACPWED